MLKKLTVKEALQLLAEKYPEPVKGWFWDEDENDKDKGRLYYVHNEDCTSYVFVSDFNGRSKYYHFAIEVPDEYRYMTQQEHDIWLVTIGYKNHQMRCKGCDWYIPFDLDCEKVDNYEYRTIQEIDGKIIYGEPQEFKVRVE